MERFGPYEVRYGAFRGPRRAILSHFAIPKPHSGLIMGTSAIIWPYLGLRGSNRNYQGTFPMCDTTLGGLYPSE